MVCPRCIASVSGIMEELEIQVRNVELGQVHLNTHLNEENKKVLNEKLKEVGFELLEPGKSAIISKIKTLIIDLVHNKEEIPNVNMSTYLSEKLNQEYSSLSRLFSSVEGITIEKFTLKQRIERVKELLFYDQLNLSEIAFRMNYSSVAHLSNQFKKETGLTPSEFKKLHKTGHRIMP